MLIFIIPPGFLNLELLDEIIFLNLYLYKIFKKKSFETFMSGERLRGGGMENIILYIFNIIIYNIFIN